MNSEQEKYLNAIIKNDINTVKSYLNNPDFHEGFNLCEDLYKACHNNHVDIVIELLKSPYIDISCRAGIFIYDAIYHKRLEIFNLFLEDENFKKALYVKDNSVVAAACMHKLNSIAIKTIKKVDSLKENNFTLFNTIFHKNDLVLSYLFELPYFKKFNLSLNDFINCNESKISWVFKLIDLIPELHNDINSYSNKFFVPYDYQLVIDKIEKYNQLKTITNNLNKF